MAPLPPPQQIVAALKAAPPPIPPRRRLKVLPPSRPDINLCKVSHKDRQTLCKMLAAEPIMWQTLATEMKFTSNDVQNIRRIAEQSNMTEPDVLLAIWGDQLNHTVTELFVVLSRVHYYSVMMAIKHLVDERYHRLIKEKSVVAYKSTNIFDTPEEKQFPKHLLTSIKLLNVSQPPLLLSNENNESEPHHQTGDNTTTSNNNYQPKLNIVNGTNRSNTNNNIGGLDVTYASAIPKISYADLATSTRNWSEAHVLGTGGFGTVFHGIWKCTEVAIKRIESRDRHAAKVQIEQSLNELRCLNYCRHDNILPLYAYSMDDGAQPCLVYKLMAGGSVEQRLFKQRKSAFPPLEWQDRMNIAIGTARGLQYLHTFNGNGKPLIHGDIKPANILLDKCTHPKIGDFGLAREGNYADAAMEVSRVYGTRPYLPREFLVDRTLSTKVDTYSFGIVLLELATGLKAYDKSYEFLNKYVRKCDMDKEYKLKDQVPADCANGQQMFERLMWQGKQCSADDPNDRPAEMVFVLKELLSEFE